MKCFVEPYNLQCAIFMMPETLVVYVGMLV